MNFSRLVTLLEAVTPEDIKKMLNSSTDFSDCEKIVALDKPNSKHGNWGFSLTSGSSCPWAGECKDLCFRHRDERRWSHVKTKTDSNFNLIKAEKTTKNMADLLYRSISLEKGARSHPLFRIHNGGDFFSGEYFDAWIEVANRLDKKLFYTYTTSIPLLVNRLNKLPSNLVITASYDTTESNKQLILKHKLKTAFIVDSPKQAEDLDLEIDKDDSLAWGGKDSFALLQHNTTSPKSSKEMVRNRTAELKKFLYKLRN